MASVQLWTKLRLFALQRSVLKWVRLLVDFHGRQIFIDGLWNGDPHPGNCLILRDGRLGLIDYGQTKRMECHERLAMARVIVAIAKGAEDGVVADAMLQAGFRIKDNTDNASMTKYAILFFDSDHETQRLGYPTPQQYFASLMLKNPLVTVPDAASKFTKGLVHTSWPNRLDNLTHVCSLVRSVFIARTSFLFRGMGTAMDQPMQTAQRWHKYAAKAIRNDNKSNV